MLVVQLSYNKTKRTLHQQALQCRKIFFVCLLFQNKRLEGEVEKNEQQIEKFKSNMKKIETENKVLHFCHRFMSKL